MGYFTFDYFTARAEVGLIRVFVGIESAALDRLKKFRKAIDVSNYLSGELHRFSVIAERTRLVPGSRLFQEVADSGLLESADYRKLGHGYRFAHEETACLYANFMDVFNAIGITRFERIEPLVVVCEFLINLMRRTGRADAAFESLADRLVAFKDEYCDCFAALCST